MNLTITGIIVDIKDAVQRGQFTSRQFWVKEIEGQYPNTFNLECQQAFALELDKHNIGDTVECSVDVRGRQWSKDGKDGCMNTLRCWKIVSKAKASASTSPTTPTDVTEEDLNLPF